MKGESYATRVGIEMDQARGKKTWEIAWKTGRTAGEMT